ncbi:peptidoglycan-binding protein [Streptomyces sp. bgisy130]|uniref:peptidoglycan-binding protein n=1 Tax=Streptomyces sp. bgisy130 TaxID=3413788 RepID=UPI003F49F3F1
MGMHRKIRVSRTRKWVSAATVAGAFTAALVASETAALADSKPGGLESPLSTSDEFPHSSTSAHRQTLTSSSASSAATQASPARATPGGGADQSTDQGTYEVYPGDGFFVEGKDSPVILALAKRLAEIGYLAPDQVSSKWGEALQSAYQKWQENLGGRGAGADGIPGATSWNELKVPATGDASTPTTPPDGNALEPFPGKGYFVEGKDSPVILALAKRLAEIGYLAPDQVSSKWGEALQSTYQKWQENLGGRGAGADGIPGATSWNELKVPATGDASTPTTPPDGNALEPFPGKGYFVEGKDSPVILALAKRLAEIGYLAPDQVSSKWGEALQSTYQKWQESLGYQGPDADGIPGATSWNQLKIPATEDASTSTTSPAPSTDLPGGNAQQP